MLAYSHNLCFRIQKIYNINNGKFDKIALTSYKMILAY